MRLFPQNVKSKINEAISFRKNLLHWIADYAVKCQPEINNTNAEISLKFRVSGMLKNFAVTLIPSAGSGTPLDIPSKINLHIDAIDNANYIYESAKKDNKPAFKVNLYTKSLGPKFDIYRYNGLHCRRYRPVGKY